MKCNRFAVLFALLSLALAMTILSPSSAEAMPYCGTVYSYYNSTHTSNVGELDLDCYGNTVYSWGYATSLFDTYQNLWCCEF